MKIHLAGIGGVGMAGLAVLLKSRGHDVTGCDLARSPRTEELVRRGIPVSVGHDAAHLDGVDLLVVTPAVPADNPELAAARARGIPVRARGEVLAELVGAASDSIAVAGSHGKTTTASWIARLLIALGEKVEWAIGGETGDFFVAGGEPGGVLVVEADESDGTLANYAATTLVVTNCEYDHPDHFKTPADYAACYEAARARAKNVIEGEALHRINRLLGLDCFSELPAHNRRNALVAVEVARLRGHAFEAVASVLPSVVAARPDRRFTAVRPEGATDGKSDFGRVFTDYAHHPTEVACALEMGDAEARRTGGILRVLFQPHRYSRTRALKEDFARALRAADIVLLCPVYAAFEEPVPGGDIADLYAACREFEHLRLTNRHNPRTYLARSCREAWESIRNTASPNDVTLLLGAGDLVEMLPEIRRDLAAGRAAVRPRRRIWIGQGSNTWKSDLKLDVDYVQTTGHANIPGANLGIPWMAGIPGTLGGWVKMNAGAFGHSISEVIDSVVVDGRPIPAADCGFGYRTSNLTGEIQDVIFDMAAYRRSLKEGSKLDYLTRRKRFPPGTKGSVFKNPPGDFAGRLLEAAGCKALRVGGCRVWEEHANVIVSINFANNSDFLALARLMRLRVHEKFGVWLEPEVAGLSEEG